MKLYFKAFKAIFISFVIIILIEILVLLMNDKIEVEKNNDKDAILELSYLKKDVGQKYMVGYKNYIFFDTQAEFIQIGDSSGFYGIQPNIVKKYLSGMDYINTNCCADVGWEGYEYTADFFLRKDKNAKFLILHINPYSLPGQYSDGFSEDLLKIYYSPWRFFYKLPSIYFRNEILEFFYRYSDTKTSFDFMKDVMGEYAPKDKDYFEYLTDNHGWLPYNRKLDNLKTMPVGQCGGGIVENFYDKKNKIDLIDGLNKIHKISQKYNSKLVIVFNPVACNGKSDELNKIIEKIADFKLKNPEILIPFDFITSWDEKNFSDQWHLTPEASEKRSHELGKALKKIIEML